MIGAYEIKREYESNGRDHRYSSFFRALIPNRFRVENGDQKRGKIQKNDRGIIILNFLCTPAPSDHPGVPSSQAPRRIMRKIEMRRGGAPWE